jgi:hypothetical protein
VCQSIEPKAALRLRHPVTMRATADDPSSRRATPTAMSPLEFADSRESSSPCLLVDHDDARREVDYAAGAEKALAAAREHDWLVASMSNDWKQVFSFEGPTGQEDRP